MMSQLKMRITITGLTRFFTNEGTDDSVARLRDIFDTNDNLEYLGCNTDLSKVILKKVSALT